jgi:hypothetical protein
MAKTIGQLIINLPYKEQKMDAIIQEMDVARLTSLFDIPAEMLNSRVEVTIRPIAREKPETTAEKIRKFREKHTHESFVEHLKQRVAEGFQFDFDVEKMINGTMTEDDWQEYYKIQKQAWKKAACERFERSQCKENR